MKVVLQKETKTKQVILMTKAWAIIKSGQCTGWSGEIGPAKQLVCFFFSFCNSYYFTSFLTRVWLLFYYVHM
jgi:hypothetical protein